MRIKDNPVEVERQGFQLLYGAVVPFHSGSVVIVVGGMRMALDGGDVNDEPQEEVAERPDVACLNGLLAGEEGAVSLCGGTEFVEGWSDHGGGYFPQSALSGRRGIPPPCPSSRR